jgi:hypothetical protein
MEYCDFPVMLAVDFDHEVRPPLWLCRRCWRAVPADRVSQRPDASG